MSADRRCVHCDRSIAGYRGQAMYCGGACRAAASRARADEKAKSGCGPPPAEEPHTKRTLSVSAAPLVEIVDRMLDSASDGALARLAERLAPRLTSRGVEDQLRELARMTAEYQRVGRFVSADELAELLGVSRDAVYASKDRLGGIAIGKAGSRRPRVVFDLEAVFARRKSVPAAMEVARGRRSTGADVPLLPVKGRING